MRKRVTRDSTSTARKIVDFVSARTTRKLVTHTADSLARASCYGLIVAVFSLSMFPQPASAQEKKPTAQRVKELEQQQKQLAQRFGKLEELFIRMSELEAAANPTRAGLLMQAAKMSKQLATLQRMSVAGDLLSQGQFTRAIQEQEAGRENLVKLLELLQSENRSTRLRDERARIQEIQQEIRRLEQIQRGQTARTESGQDLKQAASDQKDIKEQLEKVAKDLNDGKEEKPQEETSSDPKKDQESKEGKQDGKQSDKEDGKEPEGKQVDKPEDGKMKDGEANPSKPNDGQEKDGQEKDAKKNDAKPKDDANPTDSDDIPPKEGGELKGDKPTDGDPKEEQKKKDSKPSDSKESKPNSKDSDPKESDSKESDSKDSEAKDSKDSKPSEGDSESDDSSKKKSPPKPESREDKARKRVEMARKRMQNAQEKLEEEKRDEAVDEQREAERELREAIDELERILRQLREEEIERSLVDVETRLRRMLDLQRAVREQTEKLGNLTGDLKDRTLELQANKLSIEQLKVVMEGQKALLLLQDEGSSTAFPEALEQVNLDAQVVSKKLTEAVVSAATIAIEDEIIGALDEMLDSLKQVQKKRDEKKKQPNQQQQQSNNQEEEPLVDSIAELKLLKTLQLRINRRTQSLAKQTNNPDDTVGQIGDPGLLSELEDLAGRQQKIHEVTRDILIKNAKD